jgi:urea transport system permease protein
MTRLRLWIHAEASSLCERTGTMPTGPQKKRDNLKPETHQQKATVNRFILTVLLSITAYGLTRADTMETFKQLASGKDKQVLEAVKGIREAKDATYYELMQAIFSGNAYVYDGLSEFSGVVIAGEGIEDDYGYTTYPLLKPYPTTDPILTVTRDPLLIAEDDLEEIETSRRIRATIQPYLTSMALFHPKPGKRRIAAETMGNGAFNAENVVLLNKAGDQEGDGDVLTVVRVAVAKLLLKSNEAGDRIKAAEGLGSLNDTFVIPLLVKQLNVEQDADVQVALDDAIGSLRRFAVFTQVVQTAFVGISLGSILVLVALGLAIIYGQMGVINMAHGEFMMIGAYTTYVIQNLFAGTVLADIFFAVSLPFAFFVAGTIGFAIEALVIRHLYGRPLESLLATWGISLILVQSARSLFGDLTAVKLPALLSGGFYLAPQVVLPYNRLFIIALTAAIVGGMYWGLNRTRFGLKIRAVTQNRDMSSCTGISVRKIDSLTFFLGAGIAGVAGWAMTLIGNVVPNMGQTYIVDAFLVVVTGGVGNLLGTISAGLGIGVINKVLEPIFQAVYAKVLILGLIILFLQVKPTGIFPMRGRMEEA